MKFYVDSISSKTAPAAYKIGLCEHLWSSMKSCKIGFRAPIRQMPRSSVGDRLKEIEDYQQKLGEECGLKVTIIEGSRPWPVKEDSKIVPKIQEIYHSLTGEEIKVTALHAALECGAFSELSPELDMASIGPDLTDVHSPGETLYLVSVAKVWHLLEELLTSLE